MLALACRVGPAGGNTKVVRASAENLVSLSSHHSTIPILLCATLAPKPTTGHLLRPAGALLWPAVTARHRRQAAIVWTVALSALPVALVGAMPAYTQAGYVGLGCIAALLLIKGLSLGSELSSPSTWLAEHAPRNPSLHASLVPATAAAGALAASCVCLLLAWVLSPAALSAWGWRVPLVFSLVVNGGHAALRLAVLRAPEEGMSAAELADRRGEHVLAVLRLVYGLTRVGWCVGLV